MRGGMHVADNASAWAGSTGSFVGVPVRGGVPAMGLGHSQLPMHSQVPMHPVQPALAHQQSMQDLTYQIERIQQIMNELNQLRLPNEIMLQLSDYITYLRKELHRLNLAAQMPPAAAAPPLPAVAVEQHNMMREPLAREASRGDAHHPSPRHDNRGDRSRGDRSRGERPSKRQWGPADTGALYIEREGFVSDVNGADDDKQTDGHGYVGNDDYGKRGR